jgi:hypothetical protein
MPHRDNQHPCRPQSHVPTNADTVIFDIRCARGGIGTSVCFVRDANTSPPAQGQAERRRNRLRKAIIGEGGAETNVHSQNELLVSE